MHKLKDGRKVMLVTVPRDPPRKPLVAMFGPHSLRYRKTTVIKDERPSTALKRTELVQRLLAAGVFL